MTAFEIIILVLLYLFGFAYTLLVLAVNQYGEYVDAKPKFLVWAALLAPFFPILLGRDIYYKLNKID